MEKCHVDENIHILNLPLYMKQTILNMMAFKTENRIPSFSLYNNLRNIMNLLESAQQMPLELKFKDSVFSYNMKQDWFAEDIDKRKFKYKKIKA